MTFWPPSITAALVTVTQEFACKRLVVHSRVQPGQFGPITFRRFPIGWICSTGRLWFSSTVTALVASWVLAMSGRPSPSKSATQMDWLGTDLPRPVKFVTAVSNLALPLPDKMESAAFFAEFAVRMSKLPSPLKSPTASADGKNDRVEKLVSAPNVPSPLFVRTLTELP